MINTNLQQIFVDAINQLHLPDIPIVLKHPADESHGDYSANIAMILFKQLKQQGIDTYTSPLDLAQAIVDQIKIIDIPQLDSITVASPGFINLRLTPEFFIAKLNPIDTLGKNQLYQHQKIVVEYTDPNPFKELHVGHIYSNTVGESIARIYEASGAIVWRADYFGDVGLHVAKSIYGMIQILDQEQQTIETYADQGLTERQRFLGQSYTLGSKLYQSDPDAKEKIEILNTHIYFVAQELLHQAENFDRKIDYQQFVQQPDAYDLNHLKKLYSFGKSWSLEYFESIYQRLGTKYDGYYPESKASEFGYEYVLNNLATGVFEKSQGAIIFPGEKFNLHTRVFINKNGLPTYEAKELGLAPLKYQDFPYTKSIIITANEINQYFKVLITALKQINPDLGNVTTHIGHGMVKLPTGKMSSRSGEVITGDTLIDQAKDKALEIINQINPNLDNKQAISDQVGIGAIKFAFLKSNIGSDIVFKFKEALSFTGMSGPYVQYTHARCCSVLNKNQQPINQNFDTLILNPDELSLLRQLSRFNQIVENSAKDISPHLICNYVYEVAQRFNRFYDHHSILENNFRLFLTQTTSQVLKQSLYLLGITAPTSM